jgi:hypothetical protein
MSERVPKKAEPPSERNLDGVKGAIVARAVAEEEFDRWTEAMGLDLDLADMDEDDRKGLAVERGRIVRALQRSHAVVNDEGELVFTPQRRKSRHKDPITFREQTGATLIATDRHKEGKNVAKLYAVLGDVCEVEQKVFAGLASSDAAFCRAVAQVFLGG